MPLSTGTRLGPYEVLAKTGEGGMGEVYRARDTRLQRDVALKVLPEAFARDPERLARFRREAQSLAALNHTNIAHIYTVEEHQDPAGGEGSATSRLALVMEFVEGPTLADRIARGPMPPDHVVAIATQIASALDNAHEHGIVHRDLKPANVKITPDGMVKILDFGLAKALTPEGASATAGDVLDSPTITSPAYLGHQRTELGIILGTAAYMSPEQARGEPVDKRTDIWAFGVLLCEMLTGRRLFHGANVTDTLAAVVRDTPNLDGVPPAMRPLVRRCLMKDPKQRLRDIGDAMALVDDRPVAAVPGAAPRSRFWPALAAGLVVAAALALWAPWRTELATESIRFEIPPPDGTTFGTNFSWSPNGRQIAFAAVGEDRRTRIWIRDLASGTVRSIPGTEIPGIGGAMSWSPDGRFIAYSDELTLKKVDAAGTTAPVVLARATYTLGNPSWGTAGTLIVGGIWGGVVSQVPETGGDLKPVTALAAAEIAHGLAFFLPDGRHFLYYRAGGPRQGIYLGSLDSPPSEQPSSRLLESSSQPEYVPSQGDDDSGFIVFVRDGRLLAQRFDPRQRTLAGDPTPIAEEVGYFGARAFFSTSRRGALAYRKGAGNQPTWFDRTGKVVGKLGEPVNITHLRISRDGTRLGASQLAEGNFDLWLTEIERGVSTRLTWNTAADSRPVWSSDGRRVVFASSRNGPGNLFMRAIDGDGREDAILENPNVKTPFDWSEDGRSLIYAEQDPTTKRNDLWVLPLDKSQPPFPWIRSPSEEWFARFSPDSRWVAYESDESGRQEVYVRPFAPPGAAPYRVSTDGGSHPEWRGDGKELYYIRQDRWLVAVDVQPGTTGIRTGPPRQLFQLPVNVGTDNVTVHPDGKRVLLLAPLGEGGRFPIHVVTNWLAALEQ